MLLSKNPLKKVPKKFPRPNNYRIINLLPDIFLELNYDKVIRVNVQLNKNIDFIKTFKLSLWQNKSFKFSIN